MCVFRCVECGDTWKVDDGKTIDNSHGLCPPCAKKQLTFLFRKRQLKEGNFDCFGKAYSGYCDQFDCLYRELCLSQSPGPREIEIIYNRLNGKAQRN